MADHHELLQLSMALGTRIDYLWGAFFVGSTGTFHFMSFNGSSKDEYSSRAIYVMFFASFLFCNCYVLTSSYEYMTALLLELQAASDFNALGTIRCYVLEYQPSIKRSVQVAYGFHIAAFLAIVHAAWRRKRRRRLSAA